MNQQACPNWHPVTWLSHALDCQLYGLDAGGHHAIYSTDSTVGVKDFFADGKNGTKSVAFAYGSLSGLEEGSGGNT